MANTRAQFQRLLFPGLYLFSMNGYDTVEPYCDKIFNVKTSSKAFEEFFGAAGTGLFVRTPENVDIPQDQFVPGFPKRLTHEEYMSSIGFSERMIKDGNKALWNERSRDLGVSAKESVDVLTHKMLNEGFPGGTILAPDGLTLFNAAHKNYRSGTQGNILSPLGTLSVLSVRSALQQGRRFFDHTGVRRVRWMFENLTIPPELEYDAEEIIRSSTRPDTTNRADNVIRGKLGIVVDPYLTNVKNYFFSVNKGRSKLFVFFRERFRTWTFYEDKPRINWVAGAFNISFGVVDWMGWLGANPA